MPTASDYAMMMAKHRESKPRPIQKLYGTHGASPEQWSAYQAKSKAWNAEYRRLSKLQKKALADQVNHIIQELEPLLK